MVLALSEKNKNEGAKKLKRGKKSKREMILAVSESDDYDDSDWILDSGASRHLVNDEKLLFDSATCSEEIAIADGKTLKLKRVGSVRLKVVARGMESTVVLTDVYLARRLSKNIVSYGKLERKGFALVYDLKGRALERRSDGAVAFDVEM